MWGRKDPRDAIIEDQRQQIADLLDRFQELVGSVHSHQVMLAKAQKGPKMGNIDHNLADPAQWMTEEEADLQWQHDMGMIDEDALKDALKNLGFENAEIHFE